MNKNIIAIALLTIMLAACTSTNTTTKTESTISVLETPSSTATTTTSIAPTNTPSATSNQSNLKTYTTAEYSIQYPAGWTVTKEQGQVEIYNPKTMVDAATNGGRTKKIKSEYVNIAETVSTQSVKAYVDNMLKTNPAFMNVSASVLQREELTINNVKAEAMIDEGEAGSAKIVTISNGKKIFTIYTSAMDIHQQNKAEVQIINSLKFK